MSYLSGKREPDGDGAEAYLAGPDAFEAWHRDWNRRLDQALRSDAQARHTVRAMKRQPQLNEYAGCEGLRGRLRAPVPLDQFLLTCDRAGHDRGDEDRER